MAKPSRLVMPHGSGWGMRKSGAARVSGTFATREAAVEAASEVARREGVDLFIFGSDGRIHERKSYRKDLPKG